MCNIIATGEGYYVFIESSLPAFDGDEARLRSDYVSDNSPACLNFWYHTFGETINALNVYARRDDAAEGDLGDLIWGSTGGRIEAWHLGFVTMSAPVPYQVKLRSFLVSTWSSNICRYFKKIKTYYYFSIHILIT